VKLVTVISCKSGYFVKLDLIIQEALAAVEIRMRGGNADRSAGFCSLYRLAGFAGFLGRLLQEILKMRFEEEAETLGNLHLAQAASLLDLSARGGLRWDQPLLKEKFPLLINYGNSPVPRRY
jgi:hypothetical protein